jgi:hypothetical protein
LDHVWLEQAINREKAFAREPGDICSIKPISNHFTIAGLWFLRLPYQYLRCARDAQAFHASTQAACCQ